MKGYTCSRICVCVNTGHENLHIYVEDVCTCAGVSTRETARERESKRVGA